MITQIGIFQILFYLLVILACIKPLGWYMAQVYENKPFMLEKFLSPVEHFIYRVCGIHLDQEMNWKSYLSAMLIFNLLGLLAVYAIQRFQIYLPLNPKLFPSLSPDLAFNTAASFSTNTNWQNYAGENTLSYLTQMLALTVQNFLSAATGMSLLVALIRGITRSETTHLGNFWVDTVRGILYILLPLSLILAITLSSLGVIQNFNNYQKVNLIQPFSYQEKNVTRSVTEQILPMGPVASQVAIKQLGTNGGGFFNTNSAHPFENPTPLTNFLEMFAIILIPAALCYTFGVMVKDRRQGWAVFSAMLIIFVPLLFTTVMSEQRGNHALEQFAIDQTAQSVVFPGGNLEGKEIRNGPIFSAIWATATTATANGSVNSMLDSFTPLGGLMPLWLMHLGEVVFGGVGSGLYGMLMLVIIAVFVTGLMVGRTPEYLGKKIEAYEMKMASIAVLVMPLFVQVFTAIAAVIPLGSHSIPNPAPHGFTEVLYAFTSMVNNNGSSFAGLHGNTPFYNILGAIAMLIGRYWIAIPTLALAGSLARKKLVPITAGTLPTHSPLFILLLVAIIIILGALTFFPALALGPIVEHLMLWGKHGN